MSLCASSVHTVKRLGHDNRFVWVWRQMADTSWASHGHFAKHCFTTKGGNCSFSHSKHFSRCSPAQCSTHSALFVDALAFVLSTSARGTALFHFDTEAWFGGCAVASKVSPQSRTARGGWPLHEPSCFSQCQARCSRQLFSLSRTAKRISCNIVYSCGYVQHDFHRAGHASLQLHMCTFIYMESQFASRKFLIFSKFLMIDPVFVSMMSDRSCCSVYLGGNGVFHVCIRVTHFSVFDMSETALASRMRHACFSCFFVRFF